MDGASPRRPANSSGRQQDIGPGTLYRYFPTREDLLEAAYQTEVEKLAAAERKFAETLPPVDALRAWMLLFVDYIAAKQIIAAVLNALAGNPKKSVARPDLGSDSRTREASDQKRRHTEGPRTPSIYIPR